MTLNIKANKNYKGLVEEQVPQNFKIMSTTDTNGALNKAKQVNKNGPEIP